MTKLIAAAAALALFAVSAHAQLGIVAGLTSNSSDLKTAYSDVVESQSVTQYHAGLVLRLKLPLGLYVQIAMKDNNTGSDYGVADIKCVSGYRDVRLFMRPYERLYSTEMYISFSILSQ